MLEWLRIGSHLVPLTFQACLLQLVWTQPTKYLDNRLVRWTRISLLPITLGLLFTNLSLLKHDRDIIPPFKVNLGCFFTGQIFKSFLLAFNRPSQTRVAKLQESKDQHVHSVPASFFQVVSLVFNDSSNPSKQVKLVTEGSNHTIRSDLVFLLSTIRRMIELNVFGLLGLYCWMSVHDEGLVGRYPILKRYEFQITAVAWGLFIWTGIDLGGCLNRISAFVFKSIYRLLSRITPYPSLLPATDLNLVDLEQTCAFFFAKPPLEATSISAFWGRHWHTMLQDLFVEAGAIPLASLVTWAFGTRKPHPRLLRLSRIIGAFAVSAILHEAGVWTAGPFDRRLRTSIFFLSQGVGVCLESAFKSLSGQRVSGPLGKIWTFAWMIFFATPMIEVWLQNIAVDHQKMFDTAQQLGFWKLLLTPFVLPKLLFSLD